MIDSNEQGGGWTVRKSGCMAALSYNHKNKTVTAKLERVADDRNCLPLSTRKGIPRTIWGKHQEWQPDHPVDAEWAKWRGDQAAETHDDEALLAELEKIDGKCKEYDENEDWASEQCYAECSWRM